MVNLDDIREHVASLFIMLNKRTVILFRIEFLVVLVTLLFFAMFLMDFYRRIIHNSFMRAVFSVFDAVSDSIVLYLLGAMQTAPFKNQLFPVWALVLVNFRYSADYISGYGVPDRRGRRFTEWRNVFKLLGSAFLNWTRGSSFSGPLWLVWYLQILRSAYRFISHNLASRAIWHGGSSELVAEYMGAMHEPGDHTGDKGAKVFNPVTMQGYKYLVYGETKQRKGDIKLKKPQYALSLGTGTNQDLSLGTGTNQDLSLGTGTDQGRKDDTKPSTGKSTRQATKWRWLQQMKKTPPRPQLITLDKFWDKKVEEGNNKADQQQPQDQQQGNNKAVKKELPLAFALSRLLRCRFEDVTLQRCIFDTNRDLVKSIVGGKVGVSDALRIMELQLAFVHDYFNTRYPMVFWCGIPSLFFSLLLSVLTMGAVFWLGVDIRKVYKPPSGELANLVKGFNIDMVITWLFIVLMIVKEMWEIITYLRSDWTKLIMVCEYVQSKLCDRRKKEADTWKDCVLLYFSSRSPKITDRRWHGFIDQYVFVESYDDKPRFWNLIHNLTTGIVPKKEDGAKLSSAIQVPGCVRTAVMNGLSKLTDVDGVAEIPGVNPPGDGRAGRRGQLPGYIMTLSDTSLSKELQRYQSYTARRSNATSASGSIVLRTASHIILVWHIATSLCEMELATRHGVDLGSPEFPCSVLSWLSSLFSSKPYLMDVDDKKGCCCCSSSLSWFTNCCCSSPSKSSDGKTEEKKQQVNGKLPPNLRETYIIANSLSRYCAYLLVSKSDLIPDSFLIPKIVFQKAVRSARDDIFKDSADSLQERYSALMEKVGKPITENDEEDVLKQGVALGKELLKPDIKEEDRWEILAGVWTELLIHIAPTWNAQAHRKCLSAGEFITHIWALLWHYDIQKSSLWPKDTGTGKSKTKSTEVEGGGDQAAAGTERRQTGGNFVSGRADIAIPIDEANDNKEKKEKGAKKLEAGDSSATSTGQLRTEGTVSLEIEEVPPDATTNVQRGMVGRAQNEQQ